MTPCVLGGAVPTTPKENLTFCDSDVVPPSATHVDVVLSQVSRRKFLAVRLTYRRSCPKTDAARIFASAVAFDVLRASPLNR